MSTLFIILFLIVFAYFLLALIFFLRQDRMMYHPAKKFIHTPSDFKLPFREVTFRTSDKQKLHGWIVGEENADRVLLFCHGNAGNISYNINFLSLFYLLGLKIFIFDYRGYGQSSGIPSEEGTYLDAEAAWKYLIKNERVPRQRIIIFGHSIGAAVAAYLATKVKPKALILEAAFTSVPELGKTIFPFFPVRMLCRYRYNTQTRITKIDVPVMVIHSLYDEKVPYRHGEALFRSAKDPKQFLQTFGSHNEGFVNCSELYMIGIRSFLSTLPS